MTSRALAWRTVAARPARALLAIVGVAVIGALLFDMLLLSRGLLVSLRELLDTAGYDVRVVASEGMPIVNTPILNASALANEISKLPEVKEVGLVRRGRALIFPPNPPETSVVLIAVSDPAIRLAWRVTSGKNLPSQPADDSEAAFPPLVISRQLAEGRGLRAGISAAIRGIVAGSPSALPPVTFRIVGVAEFDLEAGDEFVAATTMQALERVQAIGRRDDAEVVLVVSRPEFGANAAAAAIGRLRPDLHAYSNEQLVDQFHQNGFTYFRQISFVLSSITLAFAFLLVATLLSVSVNQRLHEVAALRALGISRRRIAATLIWESVWLVGTGGLLSLPVGAALALWLDNILRRMPDLPDRLHFFVFETQTVVVHVVLLAATALGAAIYPMWVATRLPIAATLRRETVS